MISRNNLVLILANTLKSTFALLSAGAGLAIFSLNTFASCTYTVESEWSNGFTANITIKNDTGAPINNWNVNW